MGARATPAAIWAPPMAKTDHPQQLQKVGKRFGVLGELFDPALPSGVPVHEDDAAPQSRRDFLGAVAWKSDRDGFFWSDDRLSDLDLTPYGGGASNTLPQLESLS